MSDEKILIERVLTGELDAFADLIERNQKMVYNLCLRMVTNQADAEDLAQEAFLKAWKGLRFYKFESSFSTWLYRLTSNVCIDFLRRQKRRSAMSFSVSDEDNALELQIADPEPGPEEQAIQRDDQNTIAGAMEQLDEEYRLILTLRTVEELSYEQIAHILDVKVGTVKSRLARARNKLRKILLETGNSFENISSNDKERGQKYDL